MALLAQTTLGLYEWEGVLADADKRFPGLETARKSDLCYATTNRQTAILRLAETASVILVVGSENSSNTQALVRVARMAGVDVPVIPGGHEAGVTAPVKQFLDPLVVGDEHYNVVSALIKSLRASDPDAFEYPFQNAANQALYQRYRLRAEQTPRLLVCGRLGEYRYYDMDQAIARALALSQRILAAESIELGIRTRPLSCGSSPSSES